MQLYTVQCTVKFIWLADFVFLLYVAQSRQSARLFLKSSELAPQPQEMVSPLLWFGGGGGGAPPPGVGGGPFLGLM